MRARKQPTTRRRTQPRKRVVPLWRRRSVLLACAAAVVAGAAGYGWWAWRAGIPQRLAEDTRVALMDRSLDLGLRVNEVYVEGRTHTPVAALRKALGVERGAPILFVDLAAARERLLALPWVSDASVERVLPDTVVIHLTERRPVALWQQDGRFALIDGTGHVIQREGLGPFSKLLVIVGDEAAAAEASDLLAVLSSETALMAQVKAAVRISGRRWNLRFNDGLDVRMPEADLAGGWRRLAAYDRRYGLVGLGLRSIDLRLPDRVVVRPVPNADSNREDRRKNA
ncbi:MAG: FtsQ-type POTRA domain-containing protein [Rhodospirillales bacterium]|nr:FtsQ-type POTRA domain-containing protein [Rhodospirillales bacterium]